MSSKPPSAGDRLDKVNYVAAKGGMEAGGYALVGSIVFNLLAQRVSPAYRGLTLQGKVLLITVVTAGSAIIGAESAVYHFNKPFIAAGQYGQETPADLEKGLGPFLFRHRFEAAGGVIFSAIAAGLLNFSANERRTGAEKFMSIRLFAHSVGLASLLGLVGIASIYSQRSRGDKKREDN